MQKKVIKNIKLVITFVIVAAFVWFLVLSPMITFHNNEKKMEDAARRYFELNSNELPTGERVKTLKLSTLYHKSFLDGDMYIPYTSKACSIENSWVKVKKDNNDYKYYTYLECGILSSTIDHKGPEITLNGGNSITVGVGEKFTDPGVKDVIDNVDGKLSLQNVTVKGNIDTSVVGTYELEYIAFDNLKNKSVVTREVKVVQTLASTIKKKLSDNKNFVGNPEDNYIRLSNQVFRVYGIDSNNDVIVISDEDVSNVNYTKIDKWLDYYYKNLNEATQKMIVKKKYCNMAVSDTSVDTTQCSSYTNAKNIYIPSVVEVNKAESGDGNFMKPNTISWVSNSKSGTKEAYITRNIFYGDEFGKSFLSYNKQENYGVRPMMTIKGDSLITGGEGTVDKPYVFGDVKKARGGSLLNERFTGEYVSVDGQVYRIIETLDDGTTKVISNFTLGTAEKTVETNGSSGDNKIVYNPSKKNSVAYFIKNKVSEYVDTSYFTIHTFKVPIYKNKIVYGEEVETKEYKAIFYAPDMYEIFSAQPQNVNTSSYWLINQSNAKRTGAAIFNVGVPYNSEIESDDYFGIRIVGHLKKSVVISSGNGTVNSPYILR